MTRSKTLKLRLTEAEHRRLKALAGKRGVSMFLRTCALGPDKRQKKSERLALVAELARTRNLLNQIARHCGRQEPINQMEILVRLICVEREVTKLTPA